MYDLVNWRQNNTRITDRHWSPNIWSRCPVAEIRNGKQPGVFVDDDMTETPLIATPTITTMADYNNGWKAFGSAGGTLIAGTEQGGVLVFTETDDNQGIGIQRIIPQFKIARGELDLFFEVRLKLSSVADTRFGVFVGLAEPLTLSATVPIAADGTLADQNFVGFHRLEGDGDQLDTVYKANGVTQVTVKADAALDVLEADTYVKLGMMYIANERRLYFVKDNQVLPDYKNIPSAAGTDFPNDVLLAPVIAMLCASADDAVLTLDGVRCYQPLAA